MKAETVRIIARPIFCLIFIGTWTISIFIHLDIPVAYQIMAILCGMEWISERAILRFKEIFGNTPKPIDPK